MSETNQERNGPVLQAAAEFERDPTTANRTALLTAVRAARAIRFYAVGGRLFMFAGGTERNLADCHGPAVAEAMRDRLNADLDAGWIPAIP